jgi:ankyrin repeat protein
MKNIKFISAGLFALAALYGCILNKYRFEYFSNTKANELAKATRKEDSEEINRILDANPELLNFIEPQYGYNLLMVSVLEGKNKSIIALLNHGADPNLKNTKSGMSAFHMSCDKFGEDRDLEIVKLLINNGANINEPIKYNRNDGIYCVTPLDLSVDISSQEQRDELFYFLIDSGADIDFICTDSTEMLFRSCMMKERMDLAKFLILEKNCLIPKIVYRSGANSEDEEDIIEYLEEKEFSKGSKNDSIRMELLEHFKNRH